MRCPECGFAELNEFGNMKECPMCHFMTYFGVSRPKFKPEEDFDAMF
ncbi:MAG: hypothetical protein NT120_02755 [Candidatus Aenigmarchaeota archaeon]|nr:hypothetical protein [Candidatus Aenigmarchaeota archaeon]